MKPGSFFLAAIALASFRPASAMAQAIPAAHRGAGEIHLGVAYDNASSDEVSKRIAGLSVYGIYKVLPYFAFEGDVHLVQYVTPQDFGLRSYVAGGRLFYHKRRYEPYVKFLGGLGTVLAQEAYVIAPGTPDTYGVFSGGGGLDIYIPKNFVVRAFDYEKEVWPAFPKHDLAPSILSFGIAYRIR